MSPLSGIASAHYRSLLSNISAGRTATQPLYRPTYGTSISTSTTFGYEPFIRHCWCFLRWVSSTRRSATLEPICRPHVRHWHITSRIASHRRKSPTVSFLQYNTPQHFLTVHCGLAVLGILPAPTLSHISHPHRYYLN